MTEPPAETPERKSIPTRQILKLVPTIAVGMTAICFSIGLLIVNINLATSGVYSTDIIRTEYILAGATFLFLAVATQVGNIYIVHDNRGNLRWWKEGQRGGAAFSAFLGLVITIIVMAFVFATISDQRLAVNDRRMWLCVGLMTFLSLTAVVIFRHARAAWEYGFELRDDKSKAPWHLLEIFAMIPFCFVWITAYATTIYPAISPVYGGGYRDHVILIPNDRGITVGKLLALPFQDSGTAIGPLRLIAESDTEIAVLSNDNNHQKPHAIKLSRSLFDAVVNVAEPDL
jgi:hypothetical protein